MQIPFGTASYQHRSLPVSAQRMVNYYLEKAPPQAKSTVDCVPAYGVESWATPGTGPIRGGLVVNERVYVVSGDSLYQINQVGDSTELGTIPGLGHVFMAADETNVMLVTGGNGYYWNGSALATITDTDFPDANFVVVMDGYFIVSDGTYFYVSANRNPASWNALDFASAEKYPDDILTGVVDHGELILLGRESGQAFYNSGNADFPLDAVASGNWEIGAMSVRSVTKSDNGVFFVGNDGLVYRLNGYTPQRVSTHAVEQWIEDAEDKEFTCLSWVEAGHKFVSVSSSSGCFVYDASTDQWHERASYGYNAWRRKFAFKAFNRWIVGDPTSNKVGMLSADTYTEWGDILRGAITSPPVSQDNRRLVHNRLELVFEHGVGNSAHADPEVMLRWSDDGGRTWSNEHTRSLGPVGEYQARTVWHRLGVARDRVYEASISDAVRRTLILATAEVTVRGY